MKLDFIQEQSFIPTSITLLEESSFAGTYKIKFRAKLQERDVINNNGRSYTDLALRTIVEQLASKATERKLLGELDHPTPQGDLEARMKRSSTIRLKDSCVVFTRLEYDGRFIVADCETLTNDPGMNLYRLLKDKIGIGFSLRAFGSAKPGPNGTALIDGTDLKALTFDVVSNPSHSNAVITEFFNESSNVLENIQMLNKLKNEIKGTELLLESDNNGMYPIDENGVRTVCDGVSCIKGTLEETTQFLINSLYKELGSIGGMSGSKLPNSKPFKFKF
jgi:hypothetical protein